MRNAAPNGRERLLQQLETLFAQPQCDVWGKPLPELRETRDGTAWLVRRGVIGPSSDPWIRQLLNVDVTLRKTASTAPTATCYEADFNLEETPKHPPIRRFTYASEGDSIITDTGEVALPDNGVYAVVSRALGAVVILPELQTIDMDPRAEAA